KQLRRLLLQPFDARPACDETFGGVALGAFRRRPHRESAVVAHKLSLETMIDQPGVAIRALQAEAARPAQRQGRVTAAIEKQERLLLAFERNLHRFRKPRCDETAARRTFAREVDRLDRRQM